MTSVLIPEYSLDWSKGKVTQHDLDYSIVEKKLHLFDTCPTTSLPYVLTDDTIFAYATLRYNGSSIRLRPYQDAIINDSHRQIDVEGANQTGKSFLLCIKALVSFLRDHGKNWTIVLVSRSQSQNGINMRMIRQILKESNITYETGQQDSMSVLTRVCSDGMVNTIVCAIAGAGGLGFAADVLMLDEFEFWQEDEGKSLEWYYDQIFLQRTNETKGQILIYSNPNGKNFVSENLQQRMTASGEFVVHTYNFDFLANPSNTREEWDERKSYMSGRIFASTMAAQRVEAEGAAIEEEDIVDMLDSELTRKGFNALVDRDCCFFVDLGFVKDQTVLVGGYCESRERSDKKPETHYYFVYKAYPRRYPVEQLWGKAEGSESSIPKIVKSYNWQRFELDLTGKEGNEVHAIEAGLSCTGIKTTGQWKAKWYDRFIALAENKRIHVSNADNWLDGDNKNFEHQARYLQITEKLPNGNKRPYPLYHHRNENDHDDIVDAVVGCLSLLDIDMNSQPSSTFIPFVRSPRSRSYDDSGIPVRDTETEEDMKSEAARINRRSRRTRFAF